MKKVFFYVLTVAFTFLIAGCDSDDSDEPSAVYQIFIEHDVESSDGRHNPDVPFHPELDNEIYKLIDNGIKAIISKYNVMSFNSEEQANKAYQEAIADINGVEKQVSDSLATGRDFGDCRFSTICSCQLLKDGYGIQKKEFTLGYNPNGRIREPRELEADTRLSETYAAVEKVVLDGHVKEIHGWKLYTENGYPSDADFGINVTLQESSADKSVFQIGYSAKKGENPGRYYILVTFELEDGLMGDLMVYLNHITA